jgi:hypothetical protein
LEANVERAGATTRAFGYIGGTPHCGSTLTSFLLNAQPNVTCVGEVHWSALNPRGSEYPCSCGATLGTCDFWSDVSRAMQKKGILYDANHHNTAFEIRGSKVVRKVAIAPLGSSIVERVRDKLVHNATGWGKHLSQIGRLNTALFDSIATMTSASVFVDSSKEPTRVRFLREYCEIDPHVIHLVRDAPAFVNSFMQKGNSIEHAIWRWNSTASQMEHLKKTTPPSRWLPVRYEDVCASPAAEIKRILHFLGVASVMPVLEFRRAPHHIIGNNNMRRRDSSEIRLDTRWREQLSKDQLQQISRDTAHYRRLFGYL